MHLSNTQRAQVAMWFEKNNLVINCPMCADIAWEYANLLWGVTNQNGHGDSQISPSAHPMVQTVCTSCGYILLLSARVLGLEKGVKQEGQ